MHAFSLHTLKKFKKNFFKVLASPLYILKYFKKVFKVLTFPLCILKKELKKFKKFKVLAFPLSILKEEFKKFKVLASKYKPKKNQKGACIIYFEKFEFFYLLAYLLFIIFKKK